MAASRWPSHTTTSSAHTRHGRTPGFPAHRRRTPATREGPSVSARGGLVPSPPQFVRHGELPSPLVEITFVEPARVDTQDLDYVAQLTLRCAASIDVPTQLAQDGVLWALQVQRLPRPHFDRAPSGELALIVRRIAFDEQVDLGDEREIEDVPRSPRAHRLGERRLVDVEVRSKRRREEGDPRLVNLDHEVDVVRGARLALQRAGEAASEKIGNAGPVEGGGDRESEIDDVGDLRSHRPARPPRRCVRPPPGRRDARRTGCAVLARSHQGGADASRPLRVSARPWSRLLPYAVAAKARGPGGGRGSAQSASWPCPAPRH